MGTVWNVKPCFAFRPVLSGFELKTFLLCWSNPRKTETVAIVVKHCLYVYRRESNSSPFNVICKSYKVCFSCHQLKQYLNSAIINWQNLVINKITFKQKQSFAIKHCKNVIALNINFYHEKFIEPKSLHTFLLFWTHLDSRYFSFCLVKVQKQVALKRPYMMECTPTITGENLPSRNLIGLQRRKRRKSFAFLAVETDTPGQIWMNVVKVSFHD